MSVTTPSVDSDSWPTLVDRLNELRLTNDWSFRELAADIERVTGFVVSAQTLQPVLTAPADERPKPYDRTVYKIRQYFKQRETPAPRRKVAAR